MLPRLSLQWRNLGGKLVSVKVSSPRIQVWNAPLAVG